MKKAASRSPLRIGVAFMLIPLLTFFPAPLYPQDFGRATRETDRLSAEKTEEETIKPPEMPEEGVKAEEAPIAEGEKRFFVKKIKLTGCESFPPESFSRILEKYENREIVLSDIDRLAKEIEREYLRRGVIAAVLLPPQEVKEGVITLRVVEAKMGELIVQRHKHFRNKRLRYYWKVAEGEVLRYDRISKSIQLMNKNPDRQVKAALVAGKKKETTDVVLSARTHFPLHAIATCDNEGSLPTGRWRIGLGGRHNNLLNSDDIFLSGCIFGKDFSGVYAYHNLPISAGGASLVYGFSSSKATPKKDYSPYDMRAGAQDLKIAVHQDLFRRDEYKGEAFLGFDAKDKMTYANSGGTINRDRLRIMRIGANFLNRSAAGNAVISPEFSQGLGFLGASPKENPIATRGAQSVYSRFSLAVSTMAPLPFGLRQSLKVSTQFASAKLNPSEQLPLGGIDSVRGYPSSDALADNAVLMNLEFQRPVPLIPRDWRLPFSEKPMSEQILSVAFLDYGYGLRRGEKKPRNLAGVGGGLKINLYRNTSIRLQWGYPVGDYPVTQGKAVHFHFSVDAQV